MDLSVQCKPAATAPEGHRTQGHGVQDFAAETLFKGDLYGGEGAEWGSHCTSYHVSLRVNPYCLSLARNSSVLSSIIERLILCLDISEHSWNAW